ncbi:hypothetical protein [uncultured Brevundimonas sp.]|uniref:hypothetical protein n=1 Tax=uncultured Brevundimonas sp. TaxID=213418 RepID=UPI0025E39AD9|nr:hypothetical protein [uncultured Brevundimonas sp.]
MLISHELTPGEMLAELLKGRRVTPKDTARFKVLRHDRDLCPIFKSHLKAMLDVYAAYRQDAHDMQSIRDDGVDVLLKYQDRDEVDRRAALQIKSNDEFDKWEKGTLALPMIAKAQYSAAVENAQIEDYYLILCVDEIRHRKKVRSLLSEFKNYKRCTIIEPCDALGFIEMSEHEVVARVTRLLCRDDVVLTAAVDELDREAPDTAYVLLAIVCQGLRGELKVDGGTLNTIWAEFLEFAPHLERDDRLGGVLSDLQGAGVLRWEGESDFIEIQNLPKAVCALYFDRKVRGLEPDGDIFTSLLHLLEVADRLADPTA